MLVAKETLDQLLLEVECCGLEQGRLELRLLAEALRAEREERRLRLLALGEFGVGKSLLLNSLLGTPALAVGPGPTTPLPCELLHGEAGEAALLTPGGLEERGPPELLTEADPAQHARARLYLPEERLRDFILVDTPGLGEAESAAGEAAAREIPAADVLLFVLHAQVGIRRSELRFLERRVLPHRRPRLVFVVNQVDWLAAEEREALLKHVRAKLAPLAPGAPVLPYSAREALAPETRERSGYPELEALLRDEILADRRRLRQAALLAALRAGLEGTLAELDAQAAAAAERAAGLQAERAEREARRRRLDARVTEIKDRAGGHLDLLAREIDTGLDALALQLEKQLPELVGKADTLTLRRHLSGYLEELLRGFLERQQAALRGRLLELIESVDRDFTESARAAGAPPPPAAGALAVALQTAGGARDPFTRLSQNAAISGSIALLVGGTGGLGFAALAVSEALRRLGAPLQEETNRARLLAAGQHAAREEVERARARLREALAEFRADLFARLDAAAAERAAALPEPEPAPPPAAPGPARAAVEALLVRVGELEAAVTRVAGWRLEVGG